MFLESTYVIYFLALLVYLLFTGLNFYRLQAKGWIHPQVVTLLLPFIANVSPSPSSTSRPSSSSRG